MESQGIFQIRPKKITPAPEITAGSNVRLSDSCVDLDKMPTIDQVEQALSSVAVNTPEERERVKDCRTWAKIIQREARP